MARSLIATKTGVKLAEVKLIDLGLNQTVLLKKLPNITSRSTVSNFFKRIPITHENFTEICRTLKLEWRDIAEMVEEGIMESVISDAIRETNLVEKQLRLAFAIAGTVDQVDQPKLTAIVKLLRQITGDASIEIVDIQEGSIKLILTGTLEALSKIQTLYRSGELPEVEGTPIEYVKLFIDESKTVKDHKIERGGLARSLLYTYQAIIAMVALQIIYSYVVLFSTDANVRDQKMMETQNQYAKELIILTLTSATGILGAAIGFYFGKEDSK